jgi:hypothetical protein
VALEWRVARRHFTAGQHVGDEHFFERDARLHNDPIRMHDDVQRSLGEGMRCGRYDQRERDRRGEKEMANRSQHGSAYDSI